MSPILMGDMIIQGNAIDGITAFNRVSAKKIWSLKLNGGVEAGAAIDNKNLYFGSSDGHFYSVKAINGQINWSFPIRSEGLSKPLVFGDFVYFLSGNNVAYALDKVTGEKKWIYTKRDPSVLSIRGGSTPQVYKNSILFAFSNGALVSLDRLSGKFLWEKQINSNKKFRDVDASPLIVDDKLYVTGFDDTLFCLKANSGQLQWRHSVGGYTAPLINKNKIYYSTTQNKLHILDKNSGKLLSTITSNKGYITRPTIYKGLLVYGESEGDLVVYALEGLKLIKRFSPGKGIASRPTIVDNNDSLGNLFFISRSANLYALDMGWRPTTDKWPWQD